MNVTLEVPATLVLINRILAVATLACHLVLRLRPADRAGCSGLLQQDVATEREGCLAQLITSSRQFAAVAPVVAPIAQIRGGVVSLGGTITVTYQHFSKVRPKGFEPLTF